jgi:tRNA (Thr-GGU) A37 N-methylase
MEIGMTGGEQPSRWFRVQPIGYVRRPDAPEPDPEAFYNPWAETALEILPRWEEALAGIEEYSHLFLECCSQLRFRNDLRSRHQFAS